MHRSIHFIGENDFIYDRSITLSSFYENPLIIFHNQGHKVPKLDIE